MRIYLVYVFVSLAGARLLAGGTRHGPARLVQIYAPRVCTLVLFIVHVITTAVRKRVP